MSQVERVHQGQVYRLVGSHPHTTRDGRDITLDVYETECVRCGVPFAVSMVAGREPFQPTRRCGDHRRVRCRKAVRSQHDPRRDYGLLA